MLVAFYVHQSDALPALPIYDGVYSSTILLCRYSETKLVPVPEGTTHIMIQPGRGCNKQAQLMYLAGFIAGSKLPAVLYGSDSEDSKLQELFHQVQVLYDVPAVSDWLHAMYVEDQQNTKFRVAREQLVEKGFSCTEHGFVEAVRQADPVATNLFLQAGFSADSCDSRGVSVLSHAVRAQLPLLAEILLASGADVNKLACDRLYSPLMDAVQKNDFAMASLLLSKGADLSLRSRDGQTALVIAVGQGSQEIVALLLRHGADPAIKDNLGMDACGYARLFHNDIISTLLINGSL